ncbi:hypothetical protein EB118_26310, partial [bacterium]|nr:hypothetical protein [bacterium]
NTFKVNVTTSSSESENNVRALASELYNNQNPRDILNTIESVQGVISTVVMDHDGVEVVLSSSPLTE